MRSILILTFAALALAVPGLAGAARTDNGVTSMTPAQILAKVKQDVAGAKSVHIYGSGASSGSSIALDLKLVKNKGGAGHLAEGGLAFDIIRIGNTAYFKGSKKFWGNFTKSAALQGFFAGKWLRASANTGDLASFTPLTDIAKLTNQILASHGTLEKGSTTTIDGHKAIAVVDKSDGGTLYIATDGPAYPLELLPGAKSGTGKITFGDWDKAVSLTTPSKSIDYKKLTG